VTAKVMGEEGLFFLKSEGHLLRGRQERLRENGTQAFFVSFFFFGFFFKAAKFAGTTM